MSKMTLLQYYRQILRTLVRAPHPLSAEEIYETDRRTLGSPNFVGFVISRQNAGEIIEISRRGDFPIYQAFEWESEDQLRSIAHVRKT